MRIYYIILFFVFTLNSNSQNWNVFNKNYRYNYKFNNSQLVSNVLFADTVKQTGADTTYIMNNIGVVTGSILTINKPQFLMKKIIKLANGDVKLQDTTNITIIPTCTLNQTWLFDTNYNLTATCVATATQTIFNLTDSVKTIIVNNADTVVLSKQFGIIQFPKLYAQNSYYHLVGIEDGTKYDTVSLFGDRVPNAWDFYDYQVGKQFCRASDSWINNNSMIYYGCYRGEDVIMSKTLTLNGYSYDVYRISKSNSSSIVQNYCATSSIPTITLNLTENFSSLHLKSIIENRMYPGMVVYNSHSNYINIAKFGLGSNGVFYKYVGSTCSSFGFSMPNANEVQGYTGGVFPSSTTWSVGSYGSFALSYGVSLGKIDESQHGFSSGSSKCTVCYGTVDLPSQKSDLKSNLIYPNPANSFITIPVDNCKLFIYDIFGKAILIQQLENKRSVDVSELPNGIYFIEIQANSQAIKQKLIIEH